MFYGYKDTNTMPNCLYLFYSNFIPKHRPRGKKAISPVSSCLSTDETGLIHTYIRIYPILIIKIHTI